MANSFQQPPRAPATLLTNAIQSAAKAAICHRKNCEGLADHLRLVEDFVEKMVATDLVKLPETREQLGRLVEELRTAAELVESCAGGKSYLYMVALGWDVVYRFRHTQAEIDRHVKVLASNPLVDEFRMQHLKDASSAVEADQRDYTLAEDEIIAQISILKPDRTRKDARTIEDSLSAAYPDSSFSEVLQEERLKLQEELNRSQAENSSDPKGRRLIEHLIDVVGGTSNDLPGRNMKKLQANSGPTYVVTGYVSNVKAIEGLGFKLFDEEEWRADLFGCCSEPCLSLKTCVNPCGTFSQIANVVSGGKISREGAIYNLIGFSLFCGCCCYSCWVRRKVRELLGIQGGAGDDFITHLMCCCCALVQEWRELQLRDFRGDQIREVIPPPNQHMKR